MRKKCVWIPSWLVRILWLLVITSLISTLYILFVKGEEE